MPLNSSIHTSNLPYKEITLNNHMILCWSVIYCFFMVT